MKILILGSCPLALELAETLLTENHEVLLLSKEEELLSRHIAHKHLSILPLNLSLSLPVSAASIDMVFALTESTEENLLYGSLLRKRGARSVVAQVLEVEDYEHLQQESREGVDHIFCPAVELARSIDTYLRGDGLFLDEEFLRSHIHISVQELFEEDPLVGKTLKDLAGAFENRVVVGILRRGHFFVPFGATRLDEGDRLYLMGEEKTSREEETKRRDLWILGEGPGTFDLVLALSHLGYAMTWSRERSFSAKERRALSRVLCRQEHLRDLWTYEEGPKGVLPLCLSGDDGENLLFAALLEEAGYRERMSILSRGEYTRVFGHVLPGIHLRWGFAGLSHLLSLLEREGDIHLSRLFGGDVEALSVRLDPASPAAGKRLAELGLPDPVAVGAILRQGLCLMVRGDTLLEAGDQLLILCEHESRRRVLELLTPQGGENFWSMIWGM